MARAPAPILLLVGLLAAPACGGLAAGDDPRREECGDGLLDPGEQCDLGAGNSDHGACTTLCRHARCGDGLLGPGETCDDANQDPDDDCNAECASRFDFTWSTPITGGQALSALTDGQVYVAGELGIAGDPQTHAVAILDGAGGAMTGGEAWYTLPVLAFSERGTLRVAARPGGGAVVAAHFAFGGDAPTAVMGWFDAAGALVSRYQSDAPGVAHEVWDVAVGPSGDAVLGGARGANGWAVVVDGDQVVWTGGTGATGVVITAVDVDGTRRGLSAGYRLPALDPFLELDEADGSRAWSVTVPPNGDDSFEDVRFGDAGSFWVAHVRREGGTVAVVERRALADGQTSAVATLDIPSTVVLAGVKVLADGGALAWGRTPSSNWLSLHTSDGARVWRANAVQLTLEVLDADSPDGVWVYAIVGGVAVAGWQAP